MLDLRHRTGPEWLDVVFGDFDAFLVDHAACERKASAMGMSLVAKYPDRTQMLGPLIEFAREELEHFHRVYRVIERRGLRLSADAKDEYVNALRGEMSTAGDRVLLDRLLVPGIIEARGCERLMMVAEALGDAERRHQARDSGDLEAMYLDLARAESRHHGLFFRLAEEQCRASEVAARAAFLLDREAEIVRALPHRAAIH